MTAINQPQSVRQGLLLPAWQQQLAQHLHLPAVEDGQVRLDRQQLDTLSSQLAAGLQRRGIQPGQTVAVCLPRSWKLAVAFLGLLKAGAVVLPLDRQSPAERIGYMLEDASCSFVVLDESCPSAIMPAQVQQGWLDGLLDTPASAWTPCNTAADHAFIIYTSGSTGKPKGVRIPEAGIMRLAQPGYIQQDAGQRYGCASNPAFDAINFEVWVPLLTGGCMVILQDECLQKPEQLTAVLPQLGIHTLFLTVSLFNAIADQQMTCFSSLTQLLVGGEALNADLIRRWYQHNPASPTRIFNVYGPTECSTFALCWPIPRDLSASQVPIGWPIAETGVAVLNAAGEPVAAGETGELCLSGAGLTPGYLHLEEANRTAFILLPEGDGQQIRFYRTGDLVRVGPDGAIDYIGRKDRQVKVRGFRIEPGEVEQQIARHPQVRQVYVCTRQPVAHGPHELLAYIQPDDELELPRLLQHMAEHLPPYMQPHWLFKVSHFPLNANGKVDRQRLLAEHDTPWRMQRDTVALSAHETAFLALAQTVLDCGPLGREDYWLANGGDSLKALRLRFECRRRWHKDLAPEALFKQPLGELAALLLQAADTDYPPLPAVSESDAVAASAEQQRLWWVQQHGRQQSAYGVLFAWQLSTAPDWVVLAAALRQLVVDYPALRTALVSQGASLLQQPGPVYDPCHFGAEGPATRSKNWQILAAHLLRQPFDLSQPGLFHAYACPDVNPGQFVLLLHMHHVAVDGWSMNLLFAALSERYQALLGGQAPVVTAAPDTRQWALWQAQWRQHPRYQQQLHTLLSCYQQAEDIERLVLPESTQAENGAMLVQHWGLDKRNQLDHYASRQQLTRFQVLLPLFAVTVYAVTGLQRLRIATPVANRVIPEFEHSVGMLANTLLLPLQLDAVTGLSSQLPQLAAEVGRLLGCQEVLLDDVLTAAPALFPAGQSLFDFMFVLENTRYDQFQLADIRARLQWVKPAQAKCPLLLSVVEQENGFDCVWEYAADVFAPEHIQQFAHAFSQLLDRLPLLEQEDPPLHALAQQNRALPAMMGQGVTVPLLYDRVCDAFHDQVLRTPQAVALQSAGRLWTYQQLDQLADALAVQIQAQGTLPQDETAEAHVALYLDASPEHIVSILALARLNLTIVPLDPSYPPALLQHVLQQVSPLMVLTQAQQRDAVSRLLAGQQVPVLDVTLHASSVSPQRRAGQRPLYTLFTSGSTGTPKGVQVSDRILCNLMQWQSAAGGLKPAARTLQYAMLSFDVSFQEILSTLCSGGCLHLMWAGGRQDAPAILDYMQQHAIERLFLPYVALQMLAEHGVRLQQFPAALKEVVTAGEQLLSTEAIRAWFAGMVGSRLFNHYGPTETHVISSLCLQGDPVSWPEQPAIGFAVDNMGLRVVDDQDIPVMPGVVGHLQLGGAFIAPCYLADATRNATRFLQEASGHYWYRSGDLACFDRDGRLHYLGRDDQQVKLSGQRLELGQVEVALMQCAEVQQALVVMDPQQKRLVACLCCHGSVPDREQLEQHLASSLPAHVRVAEYRVLASLPRTASGKLDRRQALAVPYTTLPGATPATVAMPSEPMSSLEQQLAGWFEAAVGQPIAVEQRFFDAGANSLGLMRFHLRCCDGLGRDFPVSTLFEHVTIRSLARFLQPAAAHSQVAGAPEAGATAVTSAPEGSEDRIAIIGMAVRMPGANDLASFWNMMVEGRSGISYFPVEEGRVGARSQMQGILDFDPGWFGISRQEASQMDPQQRHLLMCCVQALSHAGIRDPQAMRIGLVASCGENTYYQSQLLEGDPASRPDSFQMALHHDKDFLATKVAYHLGLTGPVFTVQSACSSSLVGTHVASAFLRQGESEVMLVGGSLVDTLLTEGYTYRPQHIFSKDGHCRPFSDDATGTIAGSGVAVVVLKPLRFAIEDGDTVYGVLAGSAINNDGRDKLGYAAPSVNGQRDVIRESLWRSGLAPEQVSYVEAHGTGTQLGDPVEVAALRQAYDVAPGHHCALSAVKSQIGHLGSAAGVAGLIRVTLSVYHGLIPPTIDFHQLNPKLAGQLEPFHIPRVAERWPEGKPRIAGISSFGIGGSNAHALVMQGPDVVLQGSAIHCLMLSSRSEAALRQDATALADYLTANPHQYSVVLRHLQAGRPTHAWRVAAQCADAASAVAWLRQVSPQQVQASGGVRYSAGQSASELAAFWLSGGEIKWPDGPAAPPWDMPVPSFQLERFSFERKLACIAGPMDAAGKLPSSEWLHQMQWVRRQPLSACLARPSSHTLLWMCAEPLSEVEYQHLARLYARVVVAVAHASQTLPGGVAGYDPADPASVDRLLQHVAQGSTAVEAVYALPLALSDAMDVQQAEACCLDWPALFLQRWFSRAEPPALSVYWLSVEAQAVMLPTQHPAQALLAGIHEVGPQELPLRSCWIDLDHHDVARASNIVPAMMPEAEGRLAVRYGYLWQPVLQPVPTPVTPAPALDLPSGGCHVILGGSGGIGSTLAATLLQDEQAQLILLSRSGELPQRLQPWQKRCHVIQADLSSAMFSVDQVLQAIAKQTDQVSSVIHAVGAAAGGLIMQRDARSMREGRAAKLNGALLAERLIQHYQPRLALYCSSMSAWFGGVGQMDYAATNSVLDAFANQSDPLNPVTRRISINWDIWKDVGMASTALSQDRMHQAHLAMGLTAAEGEQVFRAALAARQPQILVSTTPLHQAAQFYRAPVSPAQQGGAADLAQIKAHLQDCLCRWLGLSEIADDANWYESGADSLTLLDVLAELEQQYGIVLSLSQLSHKVSLQECLTKVAALMQDDRSEPSVSIDVWQRGNGHSLLCLVHPVGGDIQAYRPLVSSLGADLTICLIADPALSQNVAQTCTIAERARDYLAALEQYFPQSQWQWQLAGWSFGAWVVTEMASQLEQRHATASHVLLLDPPAPGSGRLFANYSQAEIEAVFRQELAGAQLREAGEHAHYVSRLTATCQRNLASMVDYAFPTLSRTPVSLMVASQAEEGLGGLSAPTAQDRQAWMQHLPRLVHWQVLATTHYGLMRQPMVEQVAHHLRALLEHGVHAC